MSETPPAHGVPDISRTARHYRAIWRDCFIAGLLGLLTVTPLITAAQVDLEVAAGAAQAPGMREAIERGAAPGSLLAWTIVGLSVCCLLCVGRLKPSRAIAGTLLLIAGACLVVWDSWILVKDAWKPKEWGIGSVYAAFEAGVWTVSAIDAAVALILLAQTRAAPGRPRIFAEMASFERFGRSRRASHRTYRWSRLLWMVVGAGATVVMTFALQVANAVLLRQYVLGIPADLYRNPEANLAFVQKHPGLAVASALADLAQIVLTVVLATVILRFFWRLVVADARRLLEDPDYKPIVFLRSFADDAAMVTSKRLFDRLTRRRRRLEEIAFSALAPLGAAIAIGKPGERLPKLGAVRAYYPDDEWQAAVLGWMRRAQLIVLIGGASHWTMWELRQVIDLGKHDRLVLVLPPDQDTPDQGARWAALAKTVTGTPWEAAFSTPEPADLLVALLKPDGSLLPISGNARLQSDYEAALRLAIVEMLPRMPSPT